MNRRVFLASFAVAAACGIYPSHSLAAPPPAVLLPGEASKEGTEGVGGPYPGLLVTPEGEGAETDGKYSQPYRGRVFVYVQRPAPSDPYDGPALPFDLRFAVHVPDRTTLPTAKRVARLLLYCHGVTRDRFRSDHPKNQPVVQVWLTRATGAGLSGDVGGEQFKNQIYIYDIFAERSTTEWAREVAHEYGHYALPGVSGFKEPEEWGNGVLGERLFLHWLRGDMRSGRVKPDALPFVSAAQLEAYAASQIDPLIQRIAQDGFPKTWLERRTKESMERFAGLCLYLDAVYSTDRLRDTFSLATPSDTGFLTLPDVWRGAVAALADADRLPIYPAVPESAIYLPRGQFSVEAVFCTGWHFASNTTVRRTGNTLIVFAPGWHRLTVRPEPGKAVSLHLTRKK